MNKIGWFAAIIIFVFVTVFVLSLDDTKTSKRVKFVNQNFSIRHEGTEVVNDDSVKFSQAKSNIENKNINAENKNIELSSTNIKNSDINFKNSGGVENQDTDFYDEGALKRQSTNFNNSGQVNNQGINYKNLDDSNLDMTLANAKNNAANTTKLNSSQINHLQDDRYIYKDLDWNTWHSNFVNKILDDSMNVHELDEYGEGTWFYYSFNVHKNGAITNIVVKSVYLRPEDKMKVANMIKANQFKSITIFPANSKRQVAKVSAVMMLSNTSSRAKPKDFHDGERIKIKL